MKAPDSSTCYVKTFRIKRKPDSIEVFFGTYEAAGMISKSEYV